MSQNPWKKQAQVNKAPTGPGTGNVPPWMKNKTQQPATQPVQPTQQVPPQQPNTPVTQTQPPPFVKPGGATGNPPGGAPTTGNAPPWMKNNPGTNPVPGVKPPGVGTVPGTNPPPGVKPPGTTNVPAGSGNVPPWMKNKTGTSPMGTQRSQQKQKEEQQARLKKIQQQQQKKKKQQQLIRQQKQRKRMAYEQQYSKIREQQDLINESKNKKNKKKGSPKKQQGKSPQSKSKKKLNINLTPFHKFILTLNSSCSRQQQYRQKIQHQKQFIDNLSKFCQSVREGIINYMQQRKVSQRKKNVINLQNIILQYGLVEGISGDSGNAYFRTRNIQFLQQKFSYYQVMFNLVVKLLKKLTLFRLRVPLVCRVSYKGIEFLCEGICDELLDSVSSPAQNFVQIHGQLTQLQKQLKQAGYQFLNRKVFSVKKVTIDGSQFYVLYLNDNTSNYISPESISTSCLSFYPNTPLNFDSIINLSSITSHSLGLTYCLMKQFEQNKRNVTQLFKQSYLNLFQLAHAIRIVYSSCQGELEEKSFWNLVFQQNNQIWSMIKRAYEGIYGQIKNEEHLKIKNKFMLTKILQLMIPITFGIGKQKIDKQNNIYKKVPIFLQNETHVTTLPLDSLQYYQISQLFEKNIQNPFKIKTAQQSNTIQQQILQKSDEIFMRKIIVLVNKAKVLFKKGLANKNGQMMRDAIKLIEQYQFRKGKQIQKLIIYPLLMTFYMISGQNTLREPQIVKQQQQVQKKEDVQKQTQSKRYDKSKVGSQIQQVQKHKIKKDQNNQQRQQKIKQQQEQDKSNNKNKQKIKQTQVDSQTKMLKTFNNLLIYISELFEDQNQIWYNATLYTILASYYSRIKNDPNQEIKQDKSNQESQIRQFNSQIKEDYKISAKTKMFSNSHAFDNSARKINQKQISKNRLNQSRALSQPIIEKDPLSPTLNKHPYYKQCLKFLQLSHNICLQFFGSHNPLMAQFLLHEAEIFYNVHQLSKAEASIQQALKIYKSSSKHAKNILSCSMILGKSIIERGKTEKDQKLFQNGIEILQKSAQQLFTLGRDESAIQIYDYLYKNLDSAGKSAFNKQSSPKRNEIQFIDQGSKITKMDYYLQKMTQMSLNSRNIESLKQIFKKSIKSQLNFYSKDRAIALKDLHDDYLKQQVPEDQDETDKIQRIQQIITDLQSQKLNFGGFIQMIRWSLGILKAKGDNLEWERASEVMKKVLGLFNQKLKQAKQ